MGDLLTQLVAHDGSRPEDPRQCSTSQADTDENGVCSTATRLRVFFFAHARDNRGQAWEGSWDSLKRGLARTFQPAAGNPGGDPKRSMPAICGAFFPPGANRGRDTALGVSVLLLDFDNERPEPIPGEFYEGGNRPKMRKVRIPDPVTPEQVQDGFMAAGVASVGWTTWSCKPDHPKHRWIIPLAVPVPVDRWERFTEAALEALGLAPFRRALDLGVLHNPAALAFLPGSPTPETIQRFQTDGPALAVALDRLPPMPAPNLEPWQAAMVAERQATRAAGDRWFQCYRVNGRPVEFLSLDLAPILEARGVKVGAPRPFKDGTKRRAHCPWASEHSRGVDDDSVVLIQTPGSWPSFKCSHSGHAHLGLQDLIEWAWGRP